MLFVSLIAFFLAIFLLAAITVAIAWMAFLKRKDEETEATLELPSNESGEFSEEDAQQAATILASRAEDSILFRTDRLSTVRFWDNLLARFDFVTLLQDHIVQAGLTWSVGRVTLVMLLLGTGVLLMFGHKQPLLGPALAVGAGSIPYLIIQSKRKKRFEKFREGFPDTLDSLARALRAGYSLSAAMYTVVAEANPVVAAEFSRASSEVALGVAWNQALENFSRRVPLMEVNLFASAVTLHARTGGKLSEVVNSLASNMREAAGIRGEVRALAAHGKMTGAILTILPIGIAFMMMTVSPDYMKTLYNHPNGPALILTSISCLVAAHFVIRKIVDIEV